MVVLVVVVVVMVVCTCVGGGEGVHVCTLLYIQVGYYNTPAPPPPPPAAVAIDTRHLSNVPLNDVNYTAIFQTGGGGDGRTDAPHTPCCGIEFAEASGRRRTITVWS